VTGFSCGIGAMMFLSQMGVMLGVTAVVDRTSNNMLYQSWQVLSHAAETHWSAVLVSLAVIISALLCTHFLPKAPAPLIGVLVALAVASVFGLHQKEVGRLPLEIPQFAGFSWTPTDVLDVTPEAFGLAFVSAVNLLITSRVVEHFRGRHKHLKRTDADAELGAYGVANMVAGVFAAPMSVGIPARSLASVRCGGSTRMSNLFHAGFILAFIGLGAEFISHIPIPALAGVTAYIGICLLEWSTWRRLFRMRPTDALAFLFTAAAVLVVNAVLAVAIGCSFYVLRYIYTRFQKPSRQRDALTKMAVSAR
jgi:sulfate permease, SulP family